MGEGPPPGWYDDPDNPGRQRWWNGQTWTEAVGPAEGSTMPATTGTSSPTPSTQAVSDASGDEGNHSRAQVIALAVAAVVLLGGGMAIGGLLTGPGDAQLADREPLLDETSSAPDEAGRSDGDTAEQGVEADDPPSIASTSVIASHVVDGRTYSVSPDGSSILYQPDEDEASVCVQAIGTSEPIVCSNALEMPYGRSASWSTDGRRVLLGEHPAIRVAGVLLFDLDAGHAEPLRDTIPVADRDHPSHGYWYAALSPNGTQLAALLAGPESPDRGELVIHDLETAEERRMDRPSGNMFNVVWTPDGSALWVTSGPGQGEPGQLTRIDLESGERRTLDNRVEFDGLDSDPWGALVQVSDNERIGLLVFFSLLGTGFRANVPYLAVIDLDKGDAATVLPFGPDDSDDVEHSRLMAGRLSSDGHHVVATYHPGLVSFTDDNQDAPLRLVRLSVPSILAGTYDEQVLAEGFDSLSGIENPVVHNETREMALHPLPGSERSLLLPLNRGTTDLVVDRLVGPELYIEVEFERPY